MTPVQNLITSRNSTVSLDDDKVPVGYCSSCRKKQAHLSKNFTPHPLVVLPENFKVFCNCLICQIAKLSVPPAKKKRFSGGRSKIEVNDFEVTSEKRCSICFSLLAKGFKHNCTQDSFKSNISQVVAKSKNAKIVGQCLASEVLKESDPSPKGTIRLSQATGGQKLPVVIGSAKAPIPRPQISVPSLLKLSHNLCLGVGKQRAIATWLNKELGHGTVEANFQISLSEASKTFSDDFELSSVELSHGEMAELVHVKDLPHFVSKVLDLRSLKQNYVLLKMQIDKGQGLLKFCMSIVDLFEDEQEVEYKSSGVKKIFVVAAVPEREESHKVFQTTLTKINFWDIEPRWVFSNDFKVSNILCGIQPHRARFPCHVCYAPRDDLGTRHEYRTVGSCQEDYDNFVRNGSIKAKAKHFRNQILPPLLTKDFNDATLLAQPTLQFIPPGELHLHTGVTNYLYKALLNIFPQVKEWPQFLAIEKKKWHGGQFVGNDCKRLLENVDFLQSLGAKYANFQVMPFVDTFRSLNKVRISCFGNKLDPDYNNVLEEFKANVMTMVQMPNLGVNITPKMHFIFFHVSDWCENSNDGLGLVSEQAGESIHHEFRSYFQNYQHLPGKSNGEKMLRAVQSFNAKQV